MHDQNHSNNQQHQRPELVDQSQQESISISQNNSTTTIINRLSQLQALIQQLREFNPNSNDIENYRQQDYGNENRTGDSLIKLLQSIQKQLNQTVIRMLLHIGKSETNTISNSTNNNKKDSPITITDQLLNKILKPLTNCLTTITRIHSSQTLTTLQQTLTTVINVYMTLYLQLKIDQVPKIISQLINLQCLLFTESESISAINSREQLRIEKYNKPIEITDYHNHKYRYARQRLGYRPFHRCCCQIIFQSISTLPKNMFHQMPLPSITKLMKFLYFFQSFLHQQILSTFILTSYRSLILSLNSLQKLQPQQIKRLSKQTSKQILDELSQSMNKLLFYSSENQLKQNILLLGPSYSASLFRASDSIQGRLLALRMLQKYAAQYYFKTSTAELLNNKSFAEWLAQENIWDILTNKNCQPAIIKSAEYLLKQMINVNINNSDSKSHFASDSKNKRQSRFRQFLQLIWETPFQQVRRRYLKAIDPLRLSYSEINMVLENLSVVRDDGGMYTNEEYFYLLEQLARYGSDTQRKNVLTILSNVLKKHYIQWKVAGNSSSIMYATQRKSMDAFKYCFEKLADGISDINERSELYLNILEWFVSQPNYLTLAVSRKLLDTQQRKYIPALQKAIQHMVEVKHLIEKIVSLMSSAQKSLEQRYLDQYKQKVHTSSLTFCEQLGYLLKTVLQRYNNFLSDSNKNSYKKPQLKLSQETLMQTTNFPQVFNQLVQFSDPSACQVLLQKLIRLAYQKETSFQSMRQLFYRVNSQFIKTIEPEYFHKREYKITTPNPSEQLKFLSQLQLLLLNTKFPQIQEQCGQLLAELFTNYTQQCVQQGKIKTREFMVSIRDRLELTAEWVVSIETNNKKNIAHNNSNRNEVYGLLCLTKQLLWSTEKLGIPKNHLLPHKILLQNSNQHTVRVKIWNNATYGDSIEKCYQQRVAVNMTLYQLLTIIGQKFKCPQHELYLQQGNQQGLQARYNGRTLLQLGFNNKCSVNSLELKQFCAYRNRKSPTAIQRKALKLAQTQQLNPQFTAIIKEIFTTFSNKQTLKLGQIQIKNFIRCITNSAQPIYGEDVRVQALLGGYDMDGDGLLGEDDLGRFYLDSCDGGQRQQAVWRDLGTLGYRSDLRKETQLLQEVRNQDLFRHYLQNSPKVYKLLFSLIRMFRGQNNSVNFQAFNLRKQPSARQQQKNQALDAKISSLSKQLLNHLPTFRNIKIGLQSDIDSLQQQGYNDFEKLKRLRLQFRGMSYFEIGYLLINIRQQLKQFIDNINSKSLEQQQSSLSLKLKQQLIQHFIINKNDQALYELINYLQGLEFEAYQQQHSKLNQPKKQFPNSPKKQCLKQRHIQQNKESKQVITLSLQILRLLFTSIPNLNQDFMRNQTYRIQQLQQMVSPQSMAQLNIPHYQIFLKTAQKSINELQQQVQQRKQTQKQVNNFFINDYNMADSLQVLQSSLVLALSCKPQQFQSSQFDWYSFLSNGLFHAIPLTRRLVMNFIIFYSVKNQIPIDLLSIKIQQSNKLQSEEYFTLLIFYTVYGKSCDQNAVFQYAIENIKKEQQTISKENFYNPIINGCLNLVTVLLNHSKSFKLNGMQREQLFQLLSSLMRRTLNDQNRSLGYKLMFSLDQKQTLNYISNLLKSTKPTEKYQVKQHFVGLKNLGSTCYMNSILQQFFTIKQFKHLILTYHFNQILQKTTVNQTQIVDDFMYQLQKMYSYLQWSLRKFYFPRQFCLTIKDGNKRPINTLIQQDAHEFLNNLFQKIESYMKKDQKLSVFQGLFMGRTICEICCGECKSSKVKVEDFYHLALEVRNLNSLQQTLGKFIQKQQIDDYYCEQCGQKSKITKQTLISELPQILIVNLQRIVFDLQSFQKVKVHSKLEFPLQQFDARQFLHPQSKHLAQTDYTYKLKGIVIHSGTSAGGHYYSLLKIQNQWYKFNDQTVSKFTPTELSKEAYGGKSQGYGEEEYSTNAYILFYEKVRVKKHGENQDISKQIKYHPQKLLEQEKSGSIQFYKQLQQENNNFYHELQLHQQSIFNFIVNVYQSVRPSQILQKCNSQQHPHQNSAYYSQWQQIEGLEGYYLLVDIFLQSLKLIRFCPQQLQQQTINNVSICLYELLTLLPQQACSLIQSQQKISLNQWVQTICTHPESKIRELYKVVLNKIIFVYVKYTQWKYQSVETKVLKQNQLDQQHQQIQQQKTTCSRLTQVLLRFLHPTTLQAINQNIYKSYHFFQFWLVTLSLDSQIQKFALENDLLTILIEILMANQNPFIDKNIKKMDLPNNQISSKLIQLITKILTRKTNLVGQTPFFNKQLNQNNLMQQKQNNLMQQNQNNLMQQNHHKLCYPLTQKQKKILTSQAFYTRMTRLKYDHGYLQQIIFFMSYNDHKMSSRICQLFLTLLNNIDPIQHSIELLFNNIKGFLLIVDQLQQERVKWVMGIPQFEHTGNMSYGLRQSSQSANIIYVSSRFFIGDERYRPLLQILYLKRGSYSQFQLRGIHTLLQILLNCDFSLRHILSIPPPSYFYLNYLTWIIRYVNQFSASQQYYGFKTIQNKKTFAQSLQNLLNKLMNQLSSQNNIPQLPILPKIIGLNRRVQVEECLQNEVFKIKKWVHQTYVLENLPYQTLDQVGNLSLSEEVFGMNALNQYQHYQLTQYFVQQPSHLTKTISSNNNSNLMESQQPEYEKTVNTLEIETTKPLLIKLMLPLFSYQIYTKKGKIGINFPYSQFPLQAYLGVEVIDQEQQQQEGKGNDNVANHGQGMMVQSDSVHNSNRADVKNSSVNNVDSKNNNNFDSNNYQFQMGCRTCTYINQPGRQVCEMCDSPLT